jgi:signal transduction histidine kinase
MKTEDVLAALPLFAELPAEDLARLASSARMRDFPAGQLVMEEGTPPDALFVVVEGEVEITKRSADGEIPIALRGVGEPLGEISLLEDATRTASVKTTRPSVLVEICREDFHRILAASPKATLAILHTVTSRLRTTESMLRQHEKMASLGTLAAGIAHELNNPAAAIRRGAAQLREAVETFERESTALQGVCSTPARATIADALRRSDEPCPPGPLLDPIARSDRTTALTDWLEGQGVEEPWSLAPVLVDGGWDVEGVTKLAGDFAGTELGIVIRWIAARCAVASLLREVGEGATRISELVSAVKSYSYLDQAPVKEVDVREGLESTLVILRHRLKEGVTVSLDLAADLPRIDAWAGELNQVWTNLLHNAVDAMGGKGTIAIRARAEGDGVKVEIEDDGPGIPPAIQTRIFDPFFTTKPPGVGTGLGLHITQSIVRKHRGRIGVESKPGRTMFDVWLPLRIAPKS